MMIGKKVGRKRLNCNNPTIIRPISLTDIKDKPDIQFTLQVFSSTPIKKFACPRFILSTHWLILSSPSDMFFVFETDPSAALQPWLDGEVLESWEILNSF